MKLVGFVTETFSYWKLEKNCIMMFKLKIKMFSSNYLVWSGRTSLKDNGRFII